MKKILFLFAICCTVVVTSCVGVISPTPIITPDVTPNASTNVQSNTEVFIYVEYRALQDKSDVDYGYVTQKVPIVAVNKLGEYLVDIDWGKESSSETNMEAVDLYLTDLYDDNYAESFAYETLKKSEKSHTLMYVTEEQYQKLLQWSLPKKLTRIVDLTQTEDYKKNGYLDLEPDTPPLEDVFGD